MLTNTIEDNFLLGRIEGLSALVVCGCVRISHTFVPLLRAAAAVVLLIPGLQFYLSSHGAPHLRSSWATGILKDVSSVKARPLFMLQTLCICYLSPHSYLTRSLNVHTPSLPSRTGEEAID